MSELTEQHIRTLKDAASKLTGTKRRTFQAQVAIDYMDGSPRRAERTFGWWRKTVELGLNELRTGITCVDNTSARGNRKTEVKQPELERDIHALAEPQSQQDPKFQSPFQYTRMTARAMRQALIDQKGWKSDDLPCEETTGNILASSAEFVGRFELGRFSGLMKQSDLDGFKLLEAICLSHGQFGFVVETLNNA